MILPLSYHFESHLDEQINHIINNKIPHDVIIPQIPMGIDGQQLKLSGCCEMPQEMSIAIERIQYLGQLWGIKPELLRSISFNLEMICNNMPSDQPIESVSFSPYNQHIVNNHCTPDDLIIL